MIFTIPIESPHISQNKIDIMTKEQKLLAEMAERLEQSNEAIKHLHKVYGKITLEGSLAKTANHNALFKYRRLIETNQKTNVSS